MDLDEWQRVVSNYSTQYYVSSEGNEIYYTLTAPAEYIKVNLTLEMPRIDSRMKCLEGGRWIQ